MSMSFVSAFTAHIFFQWMFLAAEGLKRSVKAAPTPHADRSVEQAADRFAYEWRHGMVGGWPILVPGFFAVAIATAVRSRDKSIRESLTEGMTTVLAATLTARPFAQVETRRLVRDFQRDAGLEREVEPRGTTWVDAGAGLLTGISWSVLVIAAQRAVAKRTLRPLLLAPGLYVLLALVRAGDVGELLVPWTRRVLQRDRTAINSLALVVATIVALWCHADRAPLQHKPGSHIASQDQLAAYP